MPFEYRNELKRVDQIEHSAPRDFACRLPRHDGTCSDDVTRLIDVSTIFVEIVITVSISQWPKIHLPTIVYDVYCYGSARQG